MPKINYAKVEGYVGIYTLPTTQGGRIEGQVKPDLSYYARYKVAGKSRRVYLGRKSEGLTPAQAANMRAKLTAGVAVDLPAPRSGRAKALKTDLDTVGDDAADDYAGPGGGRPADYWTFDRLWAAYIDHRGGADGWPNFKTDRSIYENRLRGLVGNLRPADITPLVFARVRNQVAAMRPVNAGHLSALAAAREKREAALAMVRKTRGAKRARHQRAATAAGARVKEYQRKIEDDGRRLSPTTVEGTLELLRRLALFGDQNELCPGPPRRLKLKKVDNERTEDLTPDQIAALLDACDRDPNQETADMIRLALATGLRKSSIFNLTWQNINFQKELIVIKSLTPGGRHSKSGRQLKFKMSPIVRQILATRAAVADRNFSPYVFPGKGGGKRADVGASARRIMRAAGLPDDFRPMHGLRHAFASNLANSGQVDLYQIGQLLGHSPNSPGMTQRYSHLRDNALQAAAGIMSDIMTAARSAGREEEEPLRQKGGRR